MLHVDKTREAPVEAQTSTIGNAQQLSMLLLASRYVNREEEQDQFFRPVDDDDDDHVTMAAGLRCVDCKTANLEQTNLDIWTCSFMVDYDHFDDVLSLAVCLIGQA